MEYWAIETVPVDEKEMTIRTGVNGGMMKKQNPEHKPENYIAVEPIEEYARKIRCPRRKVLVPRMEVPLVDWWTLTLDPEGNRFAIFQST
jgi:predicted enzyme related to lactoylglutathione lyase